MVEFCAERALSVGFTYFKHKNLYKYTRVARGQDGVEVKSMIDLELVKKDMLHFVQDVRAVRGMGQSISNHQVLLCKVRVMGTWIKRGEDSINRRINRRLCQAEELIFKYLTYFFNQLIFIFTTYLIM